MFARVRVVLERKMDARIVPASAMVRRNGVQGVFVVEPGAGQPGTPAGMPVGRFVPITPGIIGEQTVEVLDPPIEGLVITLGQHLLEDGGAVLLPGAGIPGGAPQGGGR